MTTGRPTVAQVSPGLVFLGLAVLGLIGCGTTTVEEAPPVAPGVTSDAPEPVGWRDELRRTAVHHGDVARRELFTWTRIEQVAALRRDRRLLTHYRGAEGQIAGFDLRLQHRPNDPVAALLRSDEMRYRRFAWVSPWPTRRGWGERDYGDQLIRVVLAAEAWIGVLDSRDGDGWRFLDLDGRRVPEAHVLASPHRLGAFSTSPSGAPTTPSLRRRVRARCRPPVTPGGVGGAGRRGSGAPTSPLLER